MPSESNPLDAATIGRSDDRPGGSRVHDGEAISVRTFEPASVSREQKMEIANELREYFAEVDAARKPVSDAEAEDIIHEAMRSVRPGYRPHQ
jgi:hypothetical protein